MALWPSPASCGKTNHIQWVCLYPTVSSSTNWRRTESWASRKRTRSGSVIRVRRHRWASLAKIAPFVRPSTKRSCENFAIHRRMQRGRLGRGPTVDTRRSYYLAPRQDDFAEALAGIHKPQSCEILCATSANDNSPWKPRLSARVWTLFRHLVAMHRPAG
jgi:hypothetical protein